MTIFDDFERTDLDGVRYSESMFSFMNRSAKPLFERTREILESWYSNFPSTHKNELASRIRSKDNHNCEGAIFELVIHELLSELGSRIQVHPKIEGTRRSPDYLVTPSSGDQFFIEATLATYETPEKLASQARIDQVFETIKRRVDTTEFYLDLEISGSPRSQPPSRKLADDINEWLDNLDPDEMGMLFEEGGFEGLPKLH